MMATLFSRRSLGQFFGHGYQDGFQRAAGRYIIMKGIFAGDGFTVGVGDYLAVIYPMGLFINIQARFAKHGL
jgi:hypothetical protein